MNNPQPIATLIERDGPHADTEHDLFVGVSIVGRGADADVVLRDRDVSRRHLELRLTSDAAFARDLGSKNGLIVDGESVGGEVEIRDGARLTVGGVIIELCHDGARVKDVLTAAGEVTRTRPRASPSSPAPSNQSSQAGRHATAAGGLAGPLVAAGVFGLLALVMLLYGS